MKEIIVFGVTLDLDQEEPIGITRQVNDIAELKDRQSDFSTEILIPLTPHNKATLGLAHIAGSQTELPYRALPAQYKYKGADVLPYGNLILQEASKTHISSILISGLFSFFDKLEGKSIRDLNLSEYDHEWTAESAAAAIDNTSGYIYPIVQTGPLLTTGANIDMTYQVPFIFFKNIIEKIFEEAGYKATGNIFNNTTYNNILFHCNNSFEHSQEFIDARSSIVGINEFIKKETFNVLAGGSMDYGPDLVRFNQEETYTTYNFAGVTTTPKTGYKDGEKNCFKSAQFKYVAIGVYKVDVSVRLPFSTVNIDGEIQVKVVLRKNGVAVGQWEQNFSSSALEVHAAEINTPLDLVSGDELDVTIEINESNSITVGSVTWPYPENSTGATIEEAFINGLNNLNSKSCYFKVTVTEEYTEGEELPISDLIHDIKQKDFIKAWAHMFGIIFDTNNLTKVIACRQFKEIAHSIGEDWSEKLDLSKDIVIKYRFDKYAQENICKYQEGEDSEPKEIGDGSFSIDDTTLKPEATIIELPFQASQQTKVFGDIECAKIPLFEFNDDTLIWERQDIGPRILLLKRESKHIVYDDSTMNFDMGPRPTPVAYFDELQDSLHFDTLLENSYKELIYVLQKCKIVYAYFNLTEADMSKLDLFEKKFVQYFGLTFYLNKVEDYTGEGSTLCELVRL